MIPQYTCRCRAYKFPHRFGGGKCDGYHIAKEHWNTMYGYGDPCSTCNNLITDDDSRSCDVVSGGEPAKRCEVVIDFVLRNNINFKL